MEFNLINSINQYNNDINNNLGDKGNISNKEPQKDFLQNESDYFQDIMRDEFDFFNNPILNSIMFDSSYNFNLSEAVNNNNIDENRRNVIHPISFRDNSNRRKMFIVQKPIYQIISTNATLSKTYQDLFNESFENSEILEEMNFTKKKRTRRTKEEIIKSINKIKSDKKRKIGRKIKREKRDSSQKCHDANSFDNIAKKLINAFLKNNLDWLNSSFVDPNDNSKFMKINKDNQQFMKICPKIIETNLNKEFMMELFDTILEKIFDNNLNGKYNKNKIDNNKILIEKLKNNNDQPFVKYILNLTFEEAFNIFCNEKEIGIDNKEFKEKLKTINIYIKEIVEKKRKNNINDDEIKDYIKRLITLASHYKNWFENRRSRKRNKRQKSQK